MNLIIVVEAEIDRVRFVRMRVVFVTVPIKKQCFQADFGLLSKWHSLSLRSVKY